MAETLGIGPLSDAHDCANSPYLPLRCRWWLESENQPWQNLLKIIGQFCRAGIICGLASNQEFNRSRYTRGVMKFGDLFDML